MAARQNQNQTHTSTNTIILACLYVLPFVLLVLVLKYCHRALSLSAGCISANVLSHPWVLYSDFYCLAIFILRPPVQIQIPAKPEDEMFSSEGRL